MPRPPPFLLRVLLSGTAATLTSTAALAVLARAEGKGAAQPVNSTSHWRHGTRAAAVTAVDAAHTGVGFATHYAACLFWAALFEALPGRIPAATARNAAGVSALAALVDYKATPRRFTPGWEFVLSRPAMAGAYAAMAAGLAASGAALSRTSSGR